jgi:hypothetical protein
MIKPRCLSALIITWNWIQHNMFRHCILFDGLGRVICNLRGACSTPLMGRMWWSWDHAYGEYLTQQCSSRLCQSLHSWCLVEACVDCTASMCAKRRAPWSPEFDFLPKNDIFQESLQHRMSESTLQQPLPLLLIVGRLQSSGSRRHRTQSFVVPHELWVIILCFTLTCRQWFFHLQTTLS